MHGCVRGNSPKGGSCHDHCCVHPVWPRRCRRSAFLPPNGAAEKLGCDQASQRPSRTWGGNNWMAPSCLGRPRDHQQPQRADPCHRDNPVPNDDVTFCRCSPPASGRSPGGSGGVMRADEVAVRPTGTNRTLISPARSFPRKIRSSRSNRIQKHTGPIPGNACAHHVRWSRKFGQGVKLGSPLRRTDLNDGQTEAVFGGFQGESCS